MADSKPTLTTADGRPIGMQQAMTAGPRGPVRGAFLLELALPNPYISYTPAGYITQAGEMEHPMTATEDGVVTEVRVEHGEQVESGALLLVVEPTEKKGDS